MDVSIVQRTSVFARASNIKRAKFCFNQLLLVPFFFFYYSATLLYLNQTYTYSYKDITQLSVDTVLIKKVFVLYSI